MPAFPRHSKPFDALTSRGSKTGREARVPQEKWSNRFRAVSVGTFNQPAPRMTAKRALALNSGAGTARFLRRLRDYFFIVPPGVCRIALLFSRSRGARALSACVFRGRRRAAGGCPCHTIFHCTTAARGRAPVLGIASGCFSRKRRLLQGPEELREVRVDRRSRSKCPSRSSYAATREHNQALF
jgi:hypothetical protein